MHHPNPQRGAIVLGGALWLAASLLVAAFVTTDVQLNPMGRTDAPPLPLAVDGEEDR